MQSVRSKTTLNDEVFIAACAGDTVLVNSLISNGASTSTALRGYAQSGHVEKVETLLRETQEKNLESARLGYLDGGQLDNQDNILHILATTTDPQFRRYLTNLHFSKDGHPPKEARDALLKVATDVHHLMKTHHFNFAQALALHGELIRINEKYKPGYFGQFFDPYTHNSFHRMHEIFKAISDIRNKDFELTTVKRPQ